MNKHTENFNEINNFLGKLNLPKLTPAKIFFENIFNHVTVIEEIAKISKELVPTLKHQTHIRSMDDVNLL